MPESTSPPATGPAGDELGLLEVLRVLIDTKKARTTSDLLKYTTQYRAPEAEERLRVLEAENIPIDLAFDSISVHLRLMAFKRNGALVAGCRGKKIGLILPLPPHVPELFVPTAGAAVFLQPDERGVHGLIHEYASKAIKGVRAARAQAQEMEVLVFEAFREGENLFVDAAVAEVIEPKMLPKGIQFIAHLRPHRNPQDVSLPAGSEIAFI